MINSLTTSDELLIADIAKGIDRGHETAELVLTTVTRFHNHLVDVALEIIEEQDLKIGLSGALPADFKFSDFEPDEVMDIDIFDYQGGYLNHSGFCGYDTNFDLALSGLIYMDHKFKNLYDIQKILGI